jgi:gluconolactonase
MKSTISLAILILVVLATSDVLADEPNSLIASGAEVEKLAGDLGFIEGPVWLPSEKKLVFSDIPAGKLMQWSEADGLSLYRKCEQANGNILDLQGRIISCQHGARNLVRQESSGTITVLADKFDGKRFNSPNDVAVRSDGTLWFTDPPWGLNEPPELPGHWVYKLDPKSGKVEVLIKDLAMPNGIVFSPDETRLYVADTGGNRKHPDPKFHTMAAGIHCFDVTPDGKLGDKRFTIDKGSDGMAVDIKGNIYATSGKVNIYDPDGKPIGQIDVAESPANVCFGDDDFKTLFITARTGLYSVRTLIEGSRHGVK